jgi:hypothetical protein
MSTNKHFAHLKILKVFAKKKRRWKGRKGFFSNGLLKDYYKNFDAYEYNKLKKNKNFLPGI